MNKDGEVRGNIILTKEQLPYLSSVINSSGEVEGTIIHNKSRST